MPTFSGNFISSSNQKLLKLPRTIDVSLRYPTDFYFYNLLNIYPGLNAPVKRAVGTLCRVSPLNSEHELRLSEQFATEIKLDFQQMLYSDMT